MDSISTGKYVELRPHSRIVHVERMHLPDPTPENRVETTFEADGEGTLMTIRMTLPDANTRAGMLATGMETGMEAELCAPGRRTQFRTRRRSTRMNANITLPTSNTRVRSSAALAIAGSIIVLALLGSLHALSPEFDPSFRMISEYACSGTMRGSCR